ncbi:unnamed protein product, partial [Ascophyllum nodosum]
KRARFGIASPSKDACLGYIDHFAEVYGQLMPHENATYLYLGSKQNCMMTLPRKGVWQANTRSATPTSPR